MPALTHAAMPAGPRGDEVVRAGQQAISSEYREILELNLREKFPVNYNLLLEIMLIENDRALKTVPLEGLLSKIEELGVKAFQNKDVHSLAKLWYLSNADQGPLDLKYQQLRKELNTLSTKLLTTVAMKHDIIVDALRKILDLTSPYRSQVLPEASAEAVKETA